MNSSYELSSNVDNSHPASAAAHPPNPLGCMWGNCQAVFASMEELVGHVNVNHLRLPPVAPPVPDNTPSFDPSSLACLWRDCHEYHSPSLIPGPSSGNQVDNTLEILASHLLQRHLGVSTRIPTPPPSRSASSSLSASNPRPSYQESTSQQPSLHTITPPPDHQCSGTHTCMWQSCGRTFTSCNDLTAHLNSEHVGSGKAHYDCFWMNCNRNGGNGFSSKQKICRHLQVGLFTSLLYMASHTFNSVSYRTQTIPV